MKKLTIALALVAAVCCSAENLIKNADFQEVDENGKLTVWKYKPSECSLAKSEVAADEGKQIVSILVTPPPEGEAKTRKSISLSQRIQLSDARKYQLTLVARVSGTAFVNCSWILYDENGKWIKASKNWSKAILKESKDWKTITQVVEFPEGAKSIDLLVTTYADRKYKHEGGTTFIKQVSLEPVTE